MRGQAAVRCRAPRGAPTHHSARGGCMSLQFALGGTRAGCSAEGEKALGARRVTLSDPDTPRGTRGLEGMMTLKQPCLSVKRGARCVQRLDDSRSAVRITYRISLRSSSSREPRYPLLKVVLINFGVRRADEPRATQMFSALACATFTGVCWLV